VATDLLADPKAGVLTLFGAGEQAADQVRAVHAVRPLQRVTVVNRHPEPVGVLFRVLRSELPDTELCVGSEVASSVADADIICCATPATSPLFAAAMLPKAVHVNAVGSYRPSMRELPDDLLASSTIVVDELEAVLVESGEIIHAIDAGVITTKRLVELGSALNSAPASRSGRTVFKSVGLAMQDWAIANLLATAFLP